MQKNKQDSFNNVHPLINFAYFALVIGIGMFCLHPVILVISVLAALSYTMYLKGVRKLLALIFKFVLPSMLVVALVNAAFNHYGVTPLLYLQSGNSITLEAIVYGVVLAIVLAIMLLWFACYNVIMTSDKFIYLFGKIIPASSLILSMVFRFVPKFAAHLKVVRNGQKSLGRDFSNGSLLHKIKAGLTIFSIMTTWALENAIDTADSMKARGYGLKGRTAFSLYRFTKRDVGLSLYLIVTSVVFFIGWRQGNVYVSYNPKIIIHGLPLTLASFSSYAAFFLLATLPLWLNLYEAIIWLRLKKAMKQDVNLPFYLKGSVSREELD